MAHLGYFERPREEFSLSAVAQHVKKTTQAASSSKRTANGNTTTSNTHDHMTEGDIIDDDSAFERYLASESPRLFVPWHIGKNPDALHQSIMRSWQAAEPTAARREEIVKLLKHLTHIINYSTTVSENADRNRYRVDAFGSMAWGGDTGKSGDLDLVIIVREANCSADARTIITHEAVRRQVGPLMIDHPSLWRVSGVRRLGAPRQTGANRKMPKIYDVQWLAKFMEHSAGMHSTKFIQATTPIVKFKVPSSNLECDINVNDLGGWYNSRLILAYCEISPHVLRPLIHALKKWLAHHNLNDSSGMGGQRSMSSYCLTLMAIAYLQSCNMLPNLQRNVKWYDAQPYNPKQEDVIWVSWGRDQGQEARVGFARTPPASWRSSHPDATVASALRGFFQFFSVRSRSCNRVFNYDESFVSVLNGGIVMRRHRHGVEADARKSYWRSLRHLPKDRANYMVARWLEEKDKNTVVGKGNSFQPRRWGHCQLVVQDPFLWEKNCAGTMEKSAVNQFIYAINITSQYLEANPDATLAGLLRLYI